MNKNLLLVGGITLIAGGAAYLYLLQQNGNGNGNGNCSDYKTEYECIRAKCYWWGGSCHSEPQQQECILPPGDQAGYGYPSGWRKCDPFNRLCEWDNNQRFWKCLETNSQTCIQNFEHNKCYGASTTGYATCAPYAEEGEDECGGIHAVRGCPCQTAICPPNYFCCKDKTCELTAMNKNISADESGSSWDCYTHSGWNACSYKLDERIAASSITGDFNYKWGPFPASWGDYQINGICNGERVVRMTGGGTIMYQSGTLDVTDNFASTCIDEIELLITCFGANIQPSSFHGNISF